MLLSFIFLKKSRYKLFNTRFHLQNILQMNFLRFDSPVRFFTINNNALLNPGIVQIKKAI